MPALPLRLNLTTRGIILVAVPLACQIVFAGGLFLLLRQVQGEIQEQVQSRDLLGAASNVVGEVASFFFLFTGGAESDSMIAQKKEVMAVIESDLNNLVALARKKMVVQKEADDLDRDCKQLVALFNSWTEEQKEGDVHANLVRHFYDRQTMVSLKAFVGDLWRMVSEEEAHYTHNYAERELSKARIANLFLLAAALSLVSAFILIFYYARMVSRPIQRLKQNSALLALRKPLLAPLDTGDEFAELDRTFREVSSAIEKAAAREQAMIDYAEDLICSLDGNNAFTSANNYSEEMLGIEGQALMGMRIAALVMPEDRELATRELAQARKSKQYHSFELRLRHRDNLPVETRWTCFWSDSEENLFCVVNNNTEQKRNERLKNSFLEVISNDLRAPLAGMKSSMQGLVAGSKGAVSDTVRDRLQSMVGSMDRLILLADNLLDSQKLTAAEITLEKRPVDLAQVIHQAIEMMSGLAEGKHVKLLAPHESLMVAGDFEKLTEVVANLLGNAIKYSPGGTTVSVGIRSIEGGTEVTVADQGPGVPEAYREKIFNAFEQTPDARAGGQGVGLGLAICKMIVQAHGGAIGVRVGRGVPAGSTFWFTLPAEKLGRK